MDLESYNFHWREGFSYGFPKKRESYDALVKSLSKRRITVLTGTRRTGKTTLMKQLMDWLVKKRIPRANILYYSFDEEQPEIREIVDEYEQKIGKELAFSKSKHYLFLDEIQKLDDWQNKVKYFYDHYNKLKFVISGSASLFIKKGVRESLAGRVSDFSLGPLSFREFLLFSEKESLIDDINLHSQTLKKDFKKYLYRQYIETVTEDKEEIKDYAKSILEKVVYVDIPQILNVENPNILMKLTKVISSNPGMLMDYSKLASTFGQESPVSRVRISNYIHYLEDSYLVKLGYNYSKSKVVSERKLKKAYLSNPSLSYYSDTNIDYGRLVEQTFFLMFKAKFFWRNPQKQEVDIILEHKGKPRPIEVKYQNQISGSDLKGLKSFMKHYNVTQGFLISKDMEDIVKTPFGEIKIIPAWKVSLSGL
jgi:predicted AAA+ superfamily ATPase